DHARRPLELRGHLVLLLPAAGALRIPLSLDLSPVGGARSRGRLLPLAPLRADDERSALELLARGRAGARDPGGAPRALLRPRRPAGATRGARHRHLSRGEARGPAGLVLAGDADLEGLAPRRHRLPRAARRSDLSLRPRLRPAPLQRRTRDPL